MTAAALAFVAVTACSGSDEPAPTDKGPGRAASLNIAIGADEGTLTPYTYVTGYPGLNLVNLVFDTLVTLDPDNQVQPLLARDLTVNADSTVFTLPLREGVTWHDGKPFTADDVLFTIDYYRQYDTARFSAPLAAVASAAADGQTVTITLNAPDPEFPVRLLADMPVIAKHVWSSVTDPEKAPTSAAVGTGPYKLSAYTKDQRYELAANTAYWRGTPKVDKLVASIVPEQQTALAALRTGEVHMVARELPAQLVEQLRRQEGTRLATGPNFSSTLLVFNSSKAPFDRTEIRKAISSAINVPDLVDTVLLGEGLPGNPGFWHPDAPGADTSAKYAFDKAAATALLDQVGAAPGPDGIRVLDGKPMNFELLVYSTSADRIRSAELISETLKTIGIGVKVVSMDSESVDAKVWPEFDVRKGRDYDMTLWGWSASTMSNFGQLASLVSSDPAVGRLNVGGVKSPQLDSAAQALTAATTADARTAAAGALQKVLADQQPFVTLYYKNGVYAYRSDAFDGWVYQKGWGILNKYSFVAAS